MNIQKVSLAMCAKHIIIQSDKGEISGNPIDLYKKYGFHAFCKALDKYIELGRVKTLNS